MKSVFDASLAPETCLEFEVGKTGHQVRTRPFDGRYEGRLSRELSLWLA